MGAVAVKTGHYTGRAANEKFIVDEPTCHDHIAWGKVNRPFDPAKFDELYKRMCAYMQGRDLFVQDCFAGATRSIVCRSVSLPKKPGIPSSPATCSSRPRRRNWKTTCAIHRHQYARLPCRPLHGRHQLGSLHHHQFRRKMIIIGGTSYAGEIKKAIFTILNYLLPVEKKILSMHCSANVGPKGDTAIFFGLSGTGKTTLSADPNSSLIGDDEHGWDDKGVFNFEGGCYAKIIKLSKEAEPEIYETTRRFGTVLENVAINTHTRRVDLDDDSFTENTRASYPITHIPNIVRTGCGGHPANIIMLTCDAFGVLPPIANLTPEQAMFHFLSGYTAKVAGTEAGITEPSATFSTCFGGPFMALNPSVYAELLREKIARHKVDCWLVNTGWSGGAYGVGSRMKIAYSRALINAAIDGVLNEGEFEKEPSSA